MTPHEVVNPTTLAPPVGFSHAVVSEGGRIAWLAGQAAQLPDGSVVGETLVEQFDTAAANLATAITAAGGEPGDLVSLHVHVTSAAEYRRHLRELGGVYRRHFGRHYPAMALFEISGLFDPSAQVELTGVAVIPDRGRGIAPSR